MTWTAYLAGNSRFGGPLAVVEGPMGDRICEVPGDPGQDPMPRAQLLAAALDTAAERDRLKAQNAELLAALEAKVAVDADLDDFHRTKGQVQESERQAYEIALVRLLVAQAKADMRARAIVHHYTSCHDKLDDGRPSHSGGMTVEKAVAPTPGPWRIPSNENIVFGPTRGLGIAKCSGPEWINPERWPEPEKAAANARLIAASPDLLAAAEVALATIEALAKPKGKATRDHQLANAHQWPVTAMLRNAVRKAKGG